MTTLYRIHWRSGDPVDYRIVLETTPTFYFGKYIMNDLSLRCIKLERSRMIRINAYGGQHDAWGHPDKWEYDYANIKKMGQWKTTDLAGCHSSSPNASTTTTNELDQHQRQAPGA